MIVAISFPCFYWRRVSKIDTTLRQHLIDLHISHCWSLDSTMHTPGLTCHAPFAARLADLRQVVVTETLDRLVQIALFCA
ncbi:hypothetical protein HBI56_144390 [Parastagonospora nodorum]|uniref:Uncharacterized protein n=1 Tax=Phaeosphaeria nodorum (strain SN15 / ATCC MYA-4574 / FGSC 10173) TaxID=321614 RepID=A0A7U2I3F0_PHANO|nr:hypothetical protein HBH56_032630 [Parastagonospora nodorum]QRD00304.1 hypothetical protein JI435_414980 [Parastagonospora nodorum SN15]KAH3933741.1 hypothetical protein HBH54_066810 [Parastagonospora nodorum]KAH3979540.1 hypothetical protein HBH51_054260 [Parastagonospora nodorum]KAH4001902.1 hypothetical protein HBI10_083800 [Parastagonospora nodorum]